MKDTLTNLKIKVLALMLAAVIFTLICVSMLLGVRDKLIFPSNLVVNGTALANIEKDQVVDFLHNTYSNQKLVLAMPNDLIELDLGGCGIKLNADATVEKIDQADKTLFHNILYRGAVKEVAPVFIWDKDKLSEVLNRIASENSKPAVDAKIIYQKNDFIRAIPHEKGYLINNNELIKAVTESLGAGKLGPIAVPYEEVAPLITLNDLQKIQGLIAVTNYKNIRLNQTDERMVSVLDNTVILAGETLNLNELWSNNDIDIRSSTINTALKTLFKNINSQIDVEYDAAANTIHNKITSPILINIYLDQDILWLSIMGNNADIQKKISLISEEIKIPAPVTKKIDNNLPAGEQRIAQGKDTVIIKKYRVVEEDGKIVEKVLLAEEEHLGYSTIIYSGPGTINK